MPTEARQYATGCCPLPRNKIRGSPFQLHVFLLVKVFVPILLNFRGYGATLNEIAAATLTPFVKNKFAIGFDAQITHPIRLSAMRPRFAP